jgi:hypothetical protein
VRESKTKYMQVFQGDELKRGGTINKNKAKHAGEWEN